MLQTHYYIYAHTLTDIMTDTINGWIAEEKILSRLTDICAQCCKK